MKWENATVRPQEGSTGRAEDIAAGYRTAQCALYASCGYGTLLYPSFRGRAQPRLNVRDRRRLRTSLNGVATITHHRSGGMERRAR